MSRFGMFAYVMLFVSSVCVRADPGRCTGECQSGALPSEVMMEEMAAKEEAWTRCRSDPACLLQKTARLESPSRAFASRSLSDVYPCINGLSAGFPCNNVDLVDWLPLSALANCSGACAVDVAGNDMWGWVDPLSGTEYALMGTTIGVCLVAVGPPPRILGFIQSQGPKPMPWRDIKVYRDVAYIVSESPGQGMQVFDLTRLRTLSEGWKPVQPDTLYTEFSTSHNLAMNVDSGFAYVTGSSTCGGGLHIVDLTIPLSPTFAGCFSQDGYTHDAECVVYAGPDIRFSGKEICFCFNEDTVTIVDVTNKSSPAMISRTGYYHVAYTHQGWLTPNMQYLFVGDEQDEWKKLNTQTRTLVFDVSNLTNIALANSFFSNATCIDHNMYYKDGFLYQANYEAGMRVLDVRDPLHIREAGFFDVVPKSQTIEWHGAWTTYPFFPSNYVIISTIEQGMFIVLFRGTHAPTTQRPSGSPTQSPSGSSQFSRCGGDAGVVSFSLPKPRQTEFVLSIPSGVVGLSLQLSAPSQAHLLLFDADWSNPIVGCTIWPSPGSLCTAQASSTWYRGMYLTYSGYASESSAMEQISVVGATPSSLGVAVSLFAGLGGSGTLQYSYTSKQSDQCLGSSTYGSSLMKPVKAKETVVVVTIPAGDSAEVNLFSTADLDLQLFEQDSGKRIFACGPGTDCSTCFKHPTTIGNYSYSGWEGLDGKRGREYLDIDYASVALVVKVFGQTAGTALVDYREHMTPASSAPVA